MGFDIHKITGYATGITSLPDKVVGRASWLKQQFDARTDNEVKDKHNALIDALGAPDSAAGLGARLPAGDGATELPAGTPHTVQGVLAALLALAAGFFARRDNPHGVTAAQTGAYTKAETDAAISQRVVEIGTGDMAKAVYDRDNDGVVDEARNAQKLGGQPPGFYQSREHRVTLPASAWAEAADGGYTVYTQTVSITGFTPSTKIVPTRASTPTGTLEEQLAVAEELGYLSKYETVDGGLKVTSVDDVPTLDLPLVITEVR